MWGNLFNNRENKIYCKYLLLNKWSEQIYIYIFCVYFLYIFIRVYKFFTKSVGILFVLR